MAVVRRDALFKTYKPITPGIRHKRMPLRDHLWKKGPIPSLTVAKRNKGGRNNTGRITVRHRGGGHKRRIRLVDFRRVEAGPQKVVRIEYDPGRSAHIALLEHSETKALSYIVAPDKLEPGMIVHSFRNYDPSKETDASTGEEITRSVNVSVGNCLLLSMIPVGINIHCIGLQPSGPAKLARSAGTFGQLLSTGNTGYAQVRLCSGEVRKIPVHAVATIGVVSNLNHINTQLGKAGARRHRGWRPSVRGAAMNRCDHPHGGGRGKSKGNTHPVSPWGKPAKGGKTRKYPNPMVVKERPRR
ncbi:translation protein SH3-like domain-containing protein [Dimargaris cristalligena]|uniref:Large ribosomal subunit protein uL2m n=1 Tax=Dimargaris cristalligena TaxID=215637 RepID=A0A4P9ZMC6_9FUNG|nr:translation protein SH3-like domain-containing protein [Dimargaris cristalligena]|eukprot:RKP34516.1 translation protein SH3-like domain-containing protein [Dimargaris cristalligena]